MARDTFTDEPETTGEEFDLKELFVRILEKEDWTDKLASVLARVRGRIHLPHEDTKLSKELRLLVPGHERGGEGLCRNDERLQRLHQRRIESISSAP